MRNSLLTAAVVLSLGCSGTKHVPASDSAKKSLETALAAWKDGKPVGGVEGSSPAIQAEDGEWRAKKKLASFEIVGEALDQPADAPRRFNVKITLDGAQPVETVYVVFGNDPVFVYRDKDYETQFSKM